mmetsp:Transcript_9666/g.15502  ORF Transcript_9666/g.15502 Transcript_9666/m.15502 type:complete len:452 (-) Transcript_9666:283-1638(-)
MMNHPKTYNNASHSLGEDKIVVMSNEDGRGSLPKKLDYVVDEVAVRYNDEASLGKELGRRVPVRDRTTTSASASRKSRSKGSVRNDSHKKKNSAARDFAKSYLAAKKSASSLVSEDGSPVEDPQDVSLDPSFTKKARWQSRSSSNFEEDSDEDSDRFSISEMKQLVMDSLPEQIRQQVPAHAWDRIFSEDDSVVSDQSPLVKRLKGGSKEDVSDIVSVISSIVSRRFSINSTASDVSGITDAFGDGNSTPASYPPSNKSPKAMKAPEPPGTEFESRKVPIPAMISLSSSEVTDSEKEPRKTKVSFHEVQVRNYKSVLTVNPAVTSGPAIGLGWKYDSSQDEKYSLDEYENVRKSGGRGSRDIILSRIERESMLLDLGYSQKDIADSIRKTIRLKNQRKQTIQNLNVSPVEEFLEKATRRVKRVLRFPVGRSSKSKIDHLQQQQPVVVQSSA